MRTSKLSASELEVCKRLREAREHILDMTLEGCAKQINLDKSTLANYETGRTPVRHEIALRFCRQFIICEEWLATGQFEACHQAAINRGMGKNGWDFMDKNMFRRQCVDLLSDPINIHIKPGTPFNEAYTQVLAARFFAILNDPSQDNFHVPRVILSSRDNRVLMLNYLKVMHERHLLLIENAAANHRIEPVEHWRIYTVRAFMCSLLLYYKTIGLKFNPDFLEQFAWLKQIASDPQAEIWGFESLPSSNPEPVLVNISEKDLMNTSSHVSFDDVKPQLPSLLDRLKKAAAAPGQKTALAKVLGAPLESVSRWLSGKQEPGGEITLKLLKWVEQQERQK